MKYQFIYYILLISNISFSQGENEPELITQEFYLNGTQIFNNGNEWIFVDKIYSNIELEKDFYVINEQNLLDNLLSDASSESLKNMYFLCDVYCFEFKKGFEIKKRILAKNIEFLKNYKEPNFKKVLSKNISEFKCSSIDIFFDSIIYLKNISGLNIVIEAIGDYYYISFLNKNCNLFERIKIKIDNFSYYETEQYFLLKTEQNLIIFTPGRGIK